ncbi:MAG TPA: hypothetical protein VGZ00_05050 [Candidatus Baltobacteraceae bacterium]|nr:hypothetical protein [Candidatus Baltobacteraceae bacterium]
MQTVADTLGSQNGVVLAGYDADGINARAVFPDGAGDIGHLVHGLDVSTLIGALELLKGSLLHDVVSLGARLFYQTTLPRTPAISTLYALVALPPDGTVDEWAAAIAGTACRNLFMGFLLARNVCKYKSESSPQERLSALENEYGDLADLPAVHGVRLALGVNDGSGAAPERIERLLAKLDDMPATDFARALSASPQRFRRYVGGLGIGQS